MGSQKPGFLKKPGFWNLVEETGFLEFLRRNPVSRFLAWTIAGEASADRPPSSAITRDAS
ncbi:MULTISPECIES: hypothetical protein [Planktothricoides]|uniref:Uncharacterized protein n=1 Tax=Planktothricoides raciborskii FACHB-1370 TaxID=2949576 RepID=A0ABR8E846_9CYAN|nr:MULTISPECIES: hypothetical protein [Planktothricoides]MBD2542695.1 hypothetical protein [Planktothricoides raciborskii FACHB-1370]MBD2581153.1 hypothetical protein [Planktothricoides raciborskii FACHB-1261]